MRYRLLYYFFLLCLFAGCTEGGRMRQQLAVLEALNVADSLLTDDTLAVRLVQYFNRHGTPNERLRAYYILGRTYTDRGELPAALDAFLDAAEQADTTKDNCNYHVLCRIYSQMAELYYRQNLMRDFLRSLDQSIVYAYKDNDTLALLNSYAHKALAYDRLNMPDSAIIVVDSTYKVLCTLGNRKRASQYLGTIIGTLISTGQISKAREYMNIYEGESGFFTDDNNIQAGREVYYYYKGLYFLSIAQFDSAEYFFRKELSTGLDFNNQNAASHGLSLLFQQTGESDSAAKYALYSYDMNDSVYANMVTEIIHEKSAIYDYNRQQKIAQSEKEKADKEHNKFLFMTLLAVMLLLGIVAIMNSARTRKKKERENHLKDIDALEKAQSEILQLMSHGEEIQKSLSELIKEKEETITQLEQRLSSYNRQSVKTIEEAEIRLKESCQYKIMHEKTNVGVLLSDDDWHSIHRIIIEILPGFYQFVSSKEYALNIKEYRLCILFRLHVSPLSASYQLESSPAFITKMSKSIMRKIYKCDGNSKELINKLLQLA